MTNKITKKDYFNKLLAIEEVAQSEKLTKFISHEIELLDKKNSSKSSKTSKSQDEVKAKVLEVLENEPNKLFTATEIAKELEFEYSVNKIAPQLKKLVAEELVIRTEEKRKSYFQLNKIED